MDHGAGFFSSHRSQVPGSNSLLGTVLEAEGCVPRVIST